MRTIKVTTPFNVDFTPNDLEIPKYILPNCLGNVEAEEIAARYITICQENGNEWQGINLRDFIETLNDDFKNIKEVCKDTYTLILLDCGRNGSTNFAEIGFQKLNIGQYITWHEENGEKYFFPTEKLIIRISKYVKK